MNYPQRPGPSRRPPPAAPRKVRGGVRFSRAAPEFPESWAAQRWVEIMTQAAPATSLTEGMEYAALGQTRQMSIEPGRVRASVQGRLPRAYDTHLAVETFTHEQWEAIIGAMLDQAVYAAKLLSGELPANIEEPLASLDIVLMPAPGRGLTVSCTCIEARAQPGLWCKHVCCAGYLAAERLAADPFLLFTLRGLPRDDLLERIRQRRQAAGAGAIGAPVYTAHVPGVSDAAAPPLEECLERFWDPPPASRRNLDLPVARPEVSHALLRRLGPSPFQPPQARFPLVGLLATCYEMVSEAVVRAEQGDGDPEPPAGDD